MDLRDRRRPLANGAADALHRPGAHVSDCETPGHAGFQGQASAAAGGYEPLVVDRDVAILQPFGGGIRAEDHEDVADRPRFRLFRVAVPPGHGFDAGLALTAQPADLGARAQLDVADAGDALDQILRHARGEAGAAHQHPDFRGVAGEKHGGLSPGVAAAPGHYLLAGANLRLDWRGPVPDAAAFHGLEIGALRAAVACSGGDDDRMALHGAAVGKLQRERIAVGSALAVEADDLRRDEHACAEFLRL